MSIELLTRNDVDVYTPCRERMWLTYPLGCDWKAIEQKYIRNPHVHLKAPQPRL